ncbi:DUF4245 domain-containing protein [Luteipulveratus mongoliensis]|uniref:DUF4245 domain-containing protein n=1 Tax=Luteipulveratus mongoliensis TaxID=571913 RepID=A0A0K1JLW9_9MICO|nr:DUF4245 domain-containing protein [Luteipulveratus mongoliensis]AKU17704.1 hypothetical protein VV02_20755 [Luteipulveratus mongoliensis]
MSTPASTASVPAAAPAPRRRGMGGSARSMIISMLVLLGACAVWVAMVPRVSSVSKPVEDVPGIAREVAVTQKWDIALPQGLSTQWIPTNVRLLKYDNQPATWHAGYQAPSGKFVSLEQTKNGSDNWIRTQTGFGKASDLVSIGGASWTKFVNEDKDQRSLVRTGPLGGLDTVVTGKASWEELQHFAGTLKPGQPGTPAS